jgi:hypothetical protein
MCIHSVRIDRKGQQAMIADRSRRQNTFAVTDMHWSRWSNLSQSVARLRVTALIHGRIRHPAKTSFP